MELSQKVKAQLDAAKEKDFKTILAQEKLNLYQLEMCLKIDNELTIQVIKSDKNIVKRIKTLYEDPNTYFVQERLNKSKDLLKVLNTNSLFQKTQERMQQLSGKDVFCIFTTPETDIEDYNKTQNLSLILNTYYEDIPLLSEYNTQENKDLYYTKFGRGKDERWINGLNPCLDKIGIYNDQPEIETLIEEKMGRIFSLGTFNTLKTNFVYISNAGAKHFREKMLKAVLKAPTSQESNFYIKYGKYVLDHKFDINSENIFIPTYKTLIEGTIKQYPEVAIKLLNQIKDEKIPHHEVELCTADYIGKLYDFSGNEDLLPILASKLKSHTKEDGTLPLYTKIVAFEYASKTKNKELNDIAIMPISKEIEIDKNTLNLFNNRGLNIFQKQFDFAPLFKELHQSEITDITIFYPHQKESKNPIPNMLISEHPHLKTISNDTYSSETPDIDADILITNSELTTIMLKETCVRHPEKLLTQLPNLREIKLAKKGYTPEEINTFYQAILSQRPQNIEQIHFPFTNEQSEELMKKYPDLLINYDEYRYTDLQRRNKYIIDAKKSKNIEDIKWVANSGGIIEYLKLIDKEDRPSFDDLNQKIENHYSNNSCFDQMREKYKNKYFEILSEVADLCGFKELKEEAKLLSAVQEKRIVEYLKSLEPEDIPPFARLTQNTVGTKEGSSIVTQIKKHYKKEEYPNVLVEILTLTKATEKDLQVLENDSEFGTIAKQYAERMKYEKNNQATKSAFEQWKEQQTSKGVK